MARMKTFAIYLLIFIGLYVGSQLLINAYIKTSYYKIETYEINADENEPTVTIMSARASKDDGYVEGKISNGTNDKIQNKYMKVELYSESNVNLGQEYVEVGELNPKDIKDFRISFSCDNVKHFIITFLTPEEKSAEDANKDTSILPNFEINEDVSRIVDAVAPNK